MLALQRGAGNGHVARMLGGGLAKSVGGEEELPSDLPADGPIDVVEDLEAGDEGVAESDGGESAGGGEVDALAKTRADGESVAVTLSLVEPGTAGFGSSHDLLSKAATRVQAGAAPSRALGGGQYGLTFPESVQVTIGAKKVGATWQPVVSNLVGLYSMQTRLLPGQSEVTGPSGNTTKANFCDQVTGLSTLGNTVGNKWYMLNAVRVHENVHATRFKPALTAAEPAITAAIEAVSVPDVAGMTKAKAIAALKADPAFVAAVQAARATWLAQILLLVAGDHAPGGPTDTAEHTVVDPMVAIICKYAKVHAWGACPVCP